MREKQKLEETVDAVKGQYNENLEIRVPWTPRERKLSQIGNCGKN